MQIAMASKAEELKERANECFKSKDFDQAIDLYTEAITMDSNQATYYANRAFAYLKKEYYGLALEDADRALTLDPKYIKGYYRRGAANFAMGKYKFALRDFELVAKKCPKDADAQKRFVECSKIVKMLAFQRAIATDDVPEKSLEEQLDVDNIVVEDSYSGPKLKDDTEVTREFMLNLMDYLKEGNKLHRKYAYRIIFTCKSILDAAPSLVDVPVPDGSKFTVCGDIHGQYYDLLNIFNLNGLPSEDNPYLFNGDIVDRGSWSVECILVLMGWKVLYPNHFHIARGNHETQNMNQMYGFEGEVKSKYSPQMYQLFTQVFNSFPLAHCINQKVLVMHGGLFAEDGVTLDSIRNTDRKRQPPEDGVMCDILWSDPMPREGRAESKRGVSKQFGPDVTENFCKQNGLDYIIRSHEVKPEGYEVAHNGKCITIFSAPNYCDQMGNKGAFITMQAPDLKPQFTTYSEVEHPPIRPMAYASSLFGSMF